MVGEDSTAACAPDPKYRCCGAQVGWAQPAELKTPRPFSIVVGPDGIVQGFYPGPWTGRTAATLPSYTGP